MSAYDPVVLCRVCRHARGDHDDSAGCMHDPCPCGGYVPPEPLPVAEPVVEHRRCTACDHPTTSHHPTEGCQQVINNGVFARTCPCGLGPQPPLGLLDVVALDRTADMLDAVAEGGPEPGPEPDPADVAHASFLLGLVAGGLMRAGYRPDEHDPHVITVPLAGNRVARVWCEVGPSGEPF